MSVDDWPIKGVMGRVLTRLASVCEWAGDKLHNFGHHMRRCPDCGRSRFYGRPCA